MKRRRWCNSECKLEMNTRTLRYVFVAFLDFIKHIRECVLQIHTLCIKLGVKN